nr:YwbE family protein [uncultured Desulfobacter sp.]
MTDGQIRANIKPGQTVSIVLKKDQRSWKLTQGVVKDLLTKSPLHPHGVKVRLEICIPEDKYQSPCLFMIPDGVQNKSTGINRAGYPVDKIESNTD